MLLDPFGRVALPASSVEELRADLRRAARIEHLHKHAMKLAQSPDEADRELAAGLLDWLSHNGDLARRLGLRGPRGRHRLRLHHRDEDKQTASGLPCVPSIIDQQATDT